MLQLQPSLIHQIKISVTSLSNMYHTVGAGIKGKTPQQLARGFNTLLALRPLKPQRR